MRKVIMVIVCLLLLAGATLGFTKQKKSLNRNALAYQHANENARFKRSSDVFNSKENKENRTNRLAEEEALQAEEAKKLEQEAQDKGEGQVKVKF